MTASDDIYLADDGEEPEGRPKRREYTDEERDAALAMYVTDGPTAVQNAMGIPKQTVWTWAASEGLRTVRGGKTAAATEAMSRDRALTREVLRSELIDKALNLLGRMDEPHVDFRGKDAGKVVFPKAPADACKAYATAAAILLDKYRLEMGEATDRTELGLVGPGRIAAMRDELEERRQGRVA